ncbi:MAG TPA: cytochrome c [Noviherbaspirillum sp.]|nr:cytochrome c [Noviherbaspirillum sp.]
MRRFAPIVIAASLLLTAAIAAVLYFGLREDDASHAQGTSIDKDVLIARGAYLARAGNCRGCHTVRGGAPYAGGRAIQTPFGIIYSSNITSDRNTGIGTWTGDDFWRALHNGKSKDGTLLYPAFPYSNYSKVTRADADALFAYFRSLAPVSQSNRAPELRFPFNQRILLAGWRALYFRPGVYQSQPDRNAEWNRGAYLVQGLGHCSACHTPRNLLGATQVQGELVGAMIPMVNWYAAALTGETAAGLGKWEVQDLVDLMQTGVSMHGVVSGPMAEVVRDSLQYMAAGDLRAVAVYLKSLPQGARNIDMDLPPAKQPENQTVLKLGATLYEKHCADCHKASGEGTPPHFPPLAGNRSITLSPPTNPIRAVLHGGYPPSTTGNPRPFGMPPFVNILSDEEAAAVLSYIRNAWGNEAPMVSAAEVNRLRAVTLD